VRVPARVQNPVGYNLSYPLGKMVPLREMRSILDNRRLLKPNSSEDPRSQARAKAAGVKFGRPKTITEKTKETVRLLRDQDVGIRKIARTLGIGVSSCYAAMG
jgi:hypothetical protein